MATPAYVTELQAAPQPSQPPQAPPQPPPPPPAAPQPPQPPATAATPQPQYVTELQSPQPQAQPPGSQKQYVTELPATPTPPQPAGAPTPSPASQQYIVVTVSEGAMRASETVSEASPGSTASQTGVPTQVVQQVQGTQQRLLVQTSVQAKPGHVSPLQLTNIPVPQQALPTQRLVVQSTAPGGKGGQVSLTVHGPQQVHSPPERSPVQANSSSSKTAGAPTGTVPQQLQVHGVQQSVPVTQERSVVQATPQAPKAGPVQQLTVQGLPPVHVAQESSGSQFPARKAEQQEPRRSSTYPYPETPLYTQTAGASYYEAAGTAAQVSTPATSQAVASSGSVPMYVSGGQVVGSSTSSGAGASNSGGALGARDLAGTPGLAELNLAYNRLVSARVHGRAFRPLRALRSLDLAGNQLTRVPGGLPRSLHTLRLQRNRLRALEPELLAGLDQLRELSLEHNRLRIGDIGPGTWHELQALQVLDLSHNELSFVPPDLPEALEELHLQGNRISHVGSEAFLSTPRLRALFLSANRLHMTSIAPEAFLGLLHLSVVDTAGNPEQVLVRLPPTAPRQPRAGGP
ncbi:MHC class II regulatory factor RFX1 [Leptonychotes weddellii]|uniref:MHC class II regulatory factor RFX1 n=1 Tax=Leptonychotes weddellii TaxID=9713 RepID=A0A7F8QI98_LEPWE|nr:MHC class II regulatory factor RFX1 [Leptonychotes weddellii]